MSRTETEPSFGFLVNDITRLLKRSFDRRAERWGLTRSQWYVMMHLDRCQGAKQAALAEVLDIRPITLARHIDRLEKAGWVRRVADRGDRRANRLYLTDQAHPVMETMRTLAREAREEALGGLSAEDRCALMALLQTVKRNLQKAEPGPEA